MPDVLVETRAGWLADKEALLDAVQSAMVAALRIPADEKVLRLIEHQPECFALPAQAAGRFVRIEITMFHGRSVTAKRALYTAIVDGLGNFGVPRQDVKIILLEVSKENVGMRGGRAACDLELGYDLNV